MNATCTLCGTDLQIDSLEGVIDHLRTEHPDQYVEPERWPDGELVDWGATLSPEDFTKEIR